MGKVTRYKTKRVTDVLEHKLEIDWTGGGKEMKGWYYLDGKKTLRVCIPHQHGAGSGDSLSQDVFHDLKNNLKLSGSDFGLLYDCPMTGTDFAVRIRDKRLA